MAPYDSSLVSRALAAGEQQMSRLSQISKRGVEYEQWQIALMVLFPTLLAVCLAAFCIYQRIHLHRMYKEQKKDNPLLQEKDFSRLGRMNTTERMSHLDLERSIMIQKSLASKTSLGSFDLGSFPATPTTVTVDRPSTATGTGDATSSPRSINDAIRGIKQFDRPRRPSNIMVGGALHPALSANSSPALPSPLSNVTTYKFLEATPLVPLQSAKLSPVKLDSPTAHLPSRPGSPLKANHKRMSSLPAQLHLLKQELMAREY